MAETNPFEPPDDKPPPVDPADYAKLLRMPDRGPLRESFGDRYFYPLIVLLGLGIVLVPWLLAFPIRFTTFGLGVMALGLWGWTSDSRKD